MIKSNQYYPTKSEAATLAEELRALFWKLTERIEADVSSLYSLDGDTKNELTEYQLARGRYPLCFLSVAERMFVRLQLYRQISRRLARSVSEINLVLDRVVAEEGGASHQN